MQATRFLKPLFRWCTGIFISLCLATLGLATTSVPPPAPQQMAQPEVENHSTLRIGLIGTIDHLHPWQLSSAAAEFVYYLTARPLNGLDGQWQWRCYLCPDQAPANSPSVKIVKAKKHPKKMEVTWRIGDKIKWGDGHPVTGYDVQFSWQIAKLGHIPMTNQAQYASIGKVIVDQAEPKVFTIHFDRINSTNHAVGGLFLLPQHLEKPYLKQMELREGDYRQSSTYFIAPFHPGLANGPYYLAERPDPKTLVLLANPYYEHTSRLRAKKVIIRVEAQVSQLVSLLENREIDLLPEVGQLPADSQSLASWQRDKGQQLGYQSIQTSSTVLEQLTFNLRNPLLGDVRVRQAMAAVLDRGELVARPLIPLGTPANTMFHPKDTEFAIKGDNVKADFARAQKLLKAAKWILSPDRVLQQDGEVFAIEIVTNAGTPMREMIAEKISQAWRKLGIQTAVRTVAAEEFTTRTIRRADFPGAALFAWERDAASLPITILDSRYIPTSRNDYSGQNVSSWENKKGDRIFDKIESTMERADKEKLLLELQHELSEDVPLIPLFFHTRLAIVAKHLGTYQPSEHQFPSSLWLDEWFLPRAPESAPTR